MKKKSRKKVLAGGRSAGGGKNPHKKHARNIPYADLPETVLFSGYITKSGTRAVINIPEGFKDLVFCEEYGREAVNVALTFPYRRIAKLQKKINDVKNGVI